MTNRLKVGNVYAFTVATEMIEFHSGRDRAVHDLKCVAMGKDIAPLLKVKYGRTPSGFWPRSTQCTHPPGN